MILATWPLWAVGALYHIYPILGWVLGLWALGRRLGLTHVDPERLKPVPLGVWIWITGMSVMAFALVMGHLDNDYGVVEIAKSLAGWVKGWGLFIVLPFAGATLKIRPHTIIRAINMLALQTLFVAPVFILASMSGMPKVIYVSPLYYLGGASPTFFEVGTHWVDPGTTDVRFRFYAPWGPASALVAQIALMLGIYDRDFRWRVVAIVHALLLCWLAKSRLSVVAIPVLMLALPMLSQLYRPAMMWVGGAATLTAALMFNILLTLVDQAVSGFAGARADSSRVRATLQTIAIHRWWKEAPVFGHGIVERGSHLVEFMPIGSHHTWNGLLFIKGGVGMLALAVPLAWTFLEMLLKAQRDRTCRAALGIVLVFFINSFGENLEILCYLLWPPMLFLGIAMKRRFVGIYSTTFGCVR